ncbi:cytochrome c oxidase assembly protein [Arthrobacter sp. ISL-95]|uniref:cytochrome c oxidase assembly protein n=1 Tax=Arthrobacter sp. ISL-95 TaxID=2819116 RepID=UPI001BE8CC6A|nr:cytochrome c oxidase assembly protein [Arthrobacter sp. ISL-95]MBT2584520.1 cytochrome c oxidase assembly protein [Arthrobacter sp. ISL-95]
MHQHPTGTGAPGILITLIVIAALYVLLVVRQSKQPKSWPRWRTGLFLAGLAVLGFGLTPQLSPYPTGSLPAHMFQHLLMGMYAPIGLVLGAPVTLLFRTIPRKQGRMLGRILRSRPLHVLAHPVTALILNVGGLAVLYFTPLYDAATRNPALHALIHLHFVAAGILFAWAIAGPDPAPRRPSVPARLVVLGVAIAGHAVISQLLYAGLFVQVDGSAAERTQAGELMYYAGDIAELLLAFALVSSWRPARQANRGSVHRSKSNKHTTAGVSSGGQAAVGRYSPERVTNT